MTPGTAGGVRRESGHKTKIGRGGRGRGRRIRKVFVVRNRGKTRKDMSKDRRRVRINNGPLTPPHFPGHASYTPGQAVLFWPNEAKGSLFLQAASFT